MKTLYKLLNDLSEELVDLQKDVNLKYLNKADFYKAQKLVAHIRMKLQLNIRESEK